MRRLCPVCWRSVARTARANIAGHVDTCSRPCPGSGEPYRIALAVHPRRRPRAEAVAA